MRRSLRDRAGCDVVAMVSRSFRSKVCGERIPTIAWRLKCLQFRHSQREVHRSRIYIPKLSWPSKDLSIDLARSTSVVPLIDDPLHSIRLIINNHASRHFRAHYCTYVTRKKRERQEGGERERK